VEMLTPMDGSFDRNVVASSYGEGCAERCQGLEYGSGTVSCQHVFANTESTLEDNVSRPPTLYMFMLKLDIYRRKTLLHPRRRITRDVTRLNQNPAPNDYSRVVATQR
jgi:hypothetical protein